MTKWIWAHNLLLCDDQVFCHYYVQTEEYLKSMKNRCGHKDFSNKFNEIIFYVKLLLLHATSYPPYVETGKQKSKNRGVQK